MKNIYNFKLWIFLIGICFTLSTYSLWTYIDRQLNNNITSEFLHEDKFVQPKSSAYWITNFIHVDGNWTYTAGNYSWCSGDGSWSTPFTIENVTINASISPTKCGIIINNSKSNYFIIRNCTVYNSGSGSLDAGIKLENTNNGRLINNNCSNNGYSGILLYKNCNNNSLLGNIANNKNTATQLRGIYLQMNCSNNLLSGNIANENEFSGIYLLNSCNDNIVVGNTVSNIETLNQDRGIFLNTNCNNNTISENKANDNIEYGIYLREHCDINCISGNNANDNNIYGIWLSNYCNDNNISGNNASNKWTTNQQRGIYLNYKCYNNKISGNTANKNSLSGIYLYDECVNNIISENTVNSNNQYGIRLKDFCYNNRILGNNASNNLNHGIYFLWYCHDNIISGNNANNNTLCGIFINEFCHSNNISGNTIYNNSQRGINLFEYCADSIVSRNIISNSLDGIYIDDNIANNIFLENFIFKNYYGIRVSYDCYNNLFFCNYMFNNSNNNTLDDGSNNNWNNSVIGNYWDDYKGEDADHDGIGDVPYNVPGGAKDNKPIMIYKYNFFKTPSDLTYEVGEIENNIEWIVINPSLYILTFNVYLEGTSIKSGNIFPAINEITLNVDGLDPGVYGFTIEVKESSVGTFTDGVWVTVSNTPPIFTTTPNDFSYEVGEIGNKLNWTFSDVSTNNSTYTISRNGVSIIINTPCLSDFPIVIPVDGLELGSHGFTIEINDGYGKTVMDSVWITVSNTLPIFTTTPNDLSYEIGQIGNELNWTFSDMSINNPTYTLSRNGVPIIIGNSCISNVPIIIPVDGLNIGSYGFTIEVNDGYGVIVLDTVEVTVTNTVPVFTAIPDDFTYEVGETGNNLTWIFSDISTNNATYTLSRNSVPLIINNHCVSGDPIIIPVDGLGVGIYGFTIEINDGYGETIIDSVWITVNSIPEPSILDILFVEIVDQSYSMEEFNITFSVYNGTGQGIVYAEIHLWWNEVDLSIDVQSLGNGLYFITLEAITVEPGEDPIPLDIEISAPGYQDKVFSTYLAVDPDTLNKDIGGGPSNLTLIISIIIISSIAAAVGIAGTTLFLLRRRKHLSE